IVSGDNPLAREGSRDKSSSVTTPASPRPTSTSHLRIRLAAPHLTRTCHLFGFFSFTRSLQQAVLGGRFRRRSIACRSAKLRLYRAETLPVVPNTSRYLCLRVRVFLVLVPRLPDRDPPAQ